MKLKHRTSSDFRIRPASVRRQKAVSYLLLAVFGFISLFGMGLHCFQPSSCGSCGCHSREYFHSSTDYGTVFRHDSCHDSDSDFIHDTCRSFRRVSPREFCKTPAFSGVSNNVQILSNPFCAICHFCQMCKAALVSNNVRLNVRVLERCAFPQKSCFYASFLSPYSTRAPPFFF